MQEGVGAMGTIQAIQSWGTDTHCPPASQPPKVANTLLQTMVTMLVLYTLVVTTSLTQTPRAEPAHATKRKQPTHQLMTNQTTMEAQSQLHSSLHSQNSYMSFHKVSHTHVSLMSHFAFRKWSTWQKHSIGHISLVTPGCHLVGLVSCGGNFSRVLVTILTLFGQSWISRPAQAISIARQFPNLHWFQSQRWNLNLSLNFYSNVHLSLNWNLRGKHVCEEALADGMVS